MNTVNNARHPSAQPVLRKEMITMDAVTDRIGPAAVGISAEPPITVTPAPLGESAGPAGWDGSTSSGGSTATGTASVSLDSIAGPEVPSIGAEGVHGRMAGAVTEARRADYAAAAELVCHVQRGQRLTSERLYGAAYAQALRTWWEQVPAQIGEQGIDAAHALRRVRSWARHYLTGEPAAARPGTLFDHALAHASRAAARQFLAATGELLTTHAANADQAQAIHRADGPHAPMSIRSRWFSRPNRRDSGSSPLRHLFHSTTAERT